MSFLVSKSPNPSGKFHVVFKDMLFDAIFYPKEQKVLILHDNLIPDIWLEFLIDNINEKNKNLKVNNENTKKLCKQLSKEITLLINQDQQIKQTLIGKIEGHLEGYV